MKTDLDVIRYIGDKAIHTWAKFIDRDISEEERVKYKNEYDILNDLYLELYSEFGYMDEVLNMVITDEFQEYFKKFMNSWVKKKFGCNCKGGSNESETY